MHRHQCKDSKPADEVTSVTDVVLLTHTTHIAERGILPRYTKSLRRQQQQTGTGLIHWRICGQRLILGTVV